MCAGAVPDRNRRRCCCCGLASHGCDEAADTDVVAVRAAIENWRDGWLYCVRICRARPWRQKRQADSADRLGSKLMAAMCW